MCIVFCSYYKYMYSSPKAKTHLYCPLRTSNLASIRADDADEQLLFVLKTGTPVKPSSKMVYKNNVLWETCYEKSKFWYNHHFQVAKNNSVAILHQEDAQHSLILRQSEVRERRELKRATSDSLKIRLRTTWHETLVTY